MMQLRENNLLVIYLYSDVIRSVYTQCTRYGTCGDYYFDRPAPTSIFDFKVTDSVGGEVDLADYKGKKKAFLIVNVASK